MRKLALAALVVFAVPGFAWGPEGHRLVARIAQGRLTPEAEARVRASLKPEESMASMASWADEVRARRTETEPWHFVDIPISSARLDMERDCPKGDCVIGRINEFRKLWRDSAASPETRREALLFLVHFVGDMHQPLHSANDTDRGGNDVPVQFEGRRMNLHHFWDSELLDGMPPEEPLFLNLSQAITPERAAEWSRGTVEDWAEEAHRLAQQTVYGRLPRVSRGETVVLGEAYERTAEPVVELQIERAGVRLAAILNEMP